MHLGRWRLQQIPRHNSEDAGEPSHGVEREVHPSFDAADVLNRNSEGLGELRLRHSGFAAQLSDAATDILNEALWILFGHAGSEGLAAVRNKSTFRLIIGRAGVTLDPAAAPLILIQTFEGGPRRLLGGKQRLGMHAQDESLQGAEARIGQTLRDKGCLDAFFGVGGIAAVYWALVLEKVPHIAIAQGRAPALSLRGAGLDWSRLGLRTG